MLTEREKEIFELIKSNQDISIPEISEMLSISVATINCTLRSLKHKDYVKRSGPDGNGRWIVLK